MIQIDPEAVSALVHALGVGGVGALAARLGLHRSTLSRWLSPTGATLPGTAQQLLALAAALDTDPVGLLRVSRDDYPRVVSQVLKSARAQRWDRFHPALDFLGELVSPPAEWPPARIAAPFARPWSAVDLFTEPVVASSGYRTLSITPHLWRSDGRPAKRVQVWHIAFQDTRGPVAGPWRAVGWVKWFAGRVTLGSLRGLSMSRAPEQASSSPRPRPPRARQLEIETWVGPQAGRFRVASLHPVTACFNAPGEAGASAAPGPIRFCEQGHGCEADVSGRPGFTDDHSLRPCPLAAWCSGYSGR